MSRRSRRRAPSCQAGTHAPAPHHKRLARRMDSVGIRIARCPSGPVGGPARSQRSLPGGTGTHALTGNEIVACWARPAHNVRAVTRVPASGRHSGTALMPCPLVPARGRQWSWSVARCQPKASSSGAGARPGAPRPSMPARRCVSKPRQQSRQRAIGELGGRSRRDDLCGSPQKPSSQGDMTCMSNGVVR